DLAGIDIDRVFQRIAIANAWSERAGIAIADDPPGALGDEIRQAARHDLASPPLDLLLIRRNLLEGGNPVQHMMLIDCRDCRQILVARWTDREIGAAH